MLTCPFFVSMNKKLVEISALNAYNNTLSGMLVFFSPDVKESANDGSKNKS